MVKKKPVRTRGKLQFSKYFQTFEEGEKVAVVREQSVIGSFPQVLQGRTGNIKAKKGRAYIVSINDKNRTKEYIIRPIHLKKIKSE